MPTEQTNGPDREFTRVEAAAFLTELGRKISPQRLATRATEGIGPPFSKTGKGRGVTYKESELRAWAVSPEAHHKGGRGKKAPGRKAKHNPSAAKAALLVGDELRKLAQTVDLGTVLREHVALADQFFQGGGDMMSAARFVRSIETLRRLVS